MVTSESLANVWFQVYRRARKLQIRSDLRPTPWLTSQSSANRSPLQSVRF
jgi:hypothetical protein